MMTPDSDGSNSLPEIQCQRSCIVPFGLAQGKLTGQAGELEDLSRRTVEQ